MKKTKKLKKRIEVPTSARLGAYLAAAIGTSAVATSEAAIVVIDIGPDGFNIGGLNAGLSSGEEASEPHFPFSDAGYLLLFNARNIGLYGGPPAVSGLGGSFGGLEFAYTGGNVSPVNFAADDMIDSSSSFTFNRFNSVFREGDTSAPDFGAGSYMGFKTNQGNFGWLEVTWDSAADNWEILAGAYESEVGVGITAGMIPEPSAFVGLMALAAGGAALMGKRRRRKVS